MACSPWPMRSAFSSRSAPQMDSGSHRFAGMNGQPQPVLRGVLVHLAELLRPGAALVAANSDAHDVSVP